MANINEKFYKLATLLIILCFCFVVTACENNNQQVQEQKQQTQQNQESNMKPIVAEEKTSQISNPFINAKVGDCIKFGNYPQISNGEEKPIEWQVLAIENNKVLVISRYGLDAGAFNRYNDWNSSDIRKWLNGYFYNKAFTHNEKRFINFSHLSDVGTTDNVFLLSNEEAEKYFTNSDERKCKATGYALKRGASIADSNFDDGKGYCWWWLRSPFSGSNELFVYAVDVVGDIDHFCALDDSFVVRPALWINL